MSEKQEDHQTTFNPSPVCTICDDAHRMQLGDREVPCTRCPTPCHVCASFEGQGAYCATTPCTCACHVHEIKITIDRRAALRQAVEDVERWGNPLSGEERAWLAAILARRY